MRSERIRMGLWIPLKFQLDLFNSSNGTELYMTLHEVQGKIGINSKESVSFYLRFTGRCHLIRSLGSVIFNF